MEEMMMALKFDPCENPLDVVNTMCSLALLQALLTSLLIAINAT